MVKVYVVEMGCYSDRYVVGVYATLEGARAATPGEEWEPWKDVWTRDTWTNELDCDDHARITEYGVEELGR